MAKIRTKAARSQKHFAMTYRNLALRAGHAVKSQIRVYRTSGRGRESFLACVKVGAKGESWRGCALGRNPRKALQAAFRSNAKHDVGARRGAFAGIKRRR